MHSIRSFFRGLPPSLSRDFISRHNEELAQRIDWNRDKSRVRQAVNKAIAVINPELQQQMQAEIERIMVMADEAGETAIRSIAADTASLGALQGRPSRGLFLFLHDHAGFKRAEAVRFSDERRQGRMWSRIRGPAGKPIVVDASAIETLKASLRERFNWGQIEIEVFERTRVGSGDNEYKLMQLTIYREG